VLDFEQVLGAWAQIYDECGDFPDEIKIMFDGYSEADEEDGVEEATTQPMLCRLRTQTLGH